MSGSPWPTVRPRSALSAAVVGVVPALLLGAPALAGSSALPSGCGVRVDVPAGTGQAWVAVAALPGLEPVRVADDGLLTGRGTVDVPLTADVARVRVALTLDGAEQAPVDVDVPACAARPATPTATLPPSTPATGTVTVGRRPSAPRAARPVTVGPPTGPLTGTTSAAAALPLTGPVASPVSAPGLAALPPLVAPLAAAAPVPQVAQPLVAAQSAVGPQSASLVAALPEPPVQPDVVIAAPAALPAPAEPPPAYADLVPAAVLLAGSLGGLVAIARRRWI